MTGDISEKQIENKLFPVIKKLKGEYLKLNSSSKNGLPDRLTLLPGARIYFLEFKRPKGGVISPIQKVIHREFERLGFPVRLVYTLDLLNDFIYEISL